MVLERSMDRDKKRVRNTLYEFVRMESPYWIQLRTVYPDTDQQETFYLPRIGVREFIPKYRMHLVRKQFPITPAFARTFSKIAGATYTAIGIDLRTQPFAHGQTYTTLARATTRAGITVYAPPVYTQARTNIPWMRNVVWEELLSEKDRHTRAIYMQSWPTVNPTHARSQPTPIRRKRHLPTQVAQPSPSQGLRPKKIRSNHKTATKTQNDMTTTDEARHEARQLRERIPCGVCETLCTATCQHCHTFLCTRHLLQHMCTQTH